MMARGSSRERRSPLWVYVKRRESVLGRRVTLSIDPDVAGEQLPEVTGGREIARRWAIVVLASQLTDAQLDLTVADLLEGRRAA